MVTFTLNTPLQVGSMSDPQTIATLQVTGVNFTSTPQLAPSGTGVLEVALLEPTSRRLEAVKYQDASALDFWSALADSAVGRSVGDVVALAVLTKLVADGKLPAGQISIS